MAIDYTLEGVKWGLSSADGTAGGNITWSLQGSFPSTEYQQEIKTAFTDWAAVSNIQFTEVADNQPADIELSRAPIDGPFGVVGRTLYNASASGQLTSAQITFDSAEPYTNSANGLVVSGDYFIAVALHEIGHAIGLDHYTAAVAIMNPTQPIGLRTLTQSDIDGAQAIYGTTQSASAASTAITFAGYGTSIKTPDGHNPALALDNVVFEQGGSDTVFSGSGNDWIWGLLGDTSNQVYYGGSGNDVAVMFGGNNLLVAGTGNATLIGGSGADTIYGGSGTDQLWGNGGFSDLIGGSGAQLLVGALLGESGTSAITGGNGNDTLIAGAGSTSATLLGGSGDDWLFGGGGTSTLIGGGTAGSLTRLVGGTGPNSIQGDAGADTIVGGNAGDTIVGGSGTLSIVAGDGANLIYAGNSTNATIQGGNGSDTITGGALAGSVTLISGQLALDGSNPDHVRDVLLGGAGTDTFYTSGGSVQDVLSQADLIWNFTPGTDVINVAAADHNLGLGATYVTNIAGTPGYSGTELFNGSSANPVAFIAGENLTLPQLSASIRQA